MCGCKKKPEPTAIIPPIQSVYDFDNMDEFFFPDTPDGLLASELEKWNKEEHKKLMDLLNDEEDYPLIHD